MADVVLDRGVRYSFEVVGADDVVKALGQADKALDDVRKSADRLDGELDGLHDDFDRAARSSAKAEAATRKLGSQFDKAERQAGGLSKTVGALGPALGAAVAAFSASELLRLGEEGSALQLVSRRLDEIGISAEQVADIGTRLGGGSTAAVEKLVAVATDGGVAFGDMGSLANAALQIVQREGGDSHDAMRELTKAVVAGDVGWLRQKGIVVDVAAAQRDFAKAAGKTTGELTEQEKVAAASRGALAELNKAFDGAPPDKYASNIGAVRDRLDNLADLIKRKLADALNDLGASLSGGSFASDHQESRAADAAQKTRVLERLLVKLEAAEGQANEQSAALIKRAASQINEQVDLDKARTVKITRLNREVMRVTSYDADAIEAARQAIIERVRSNLATQKTRTAALKATESDAARLKSEAEAAEQRRLAAQKAAQKAAAEQRQIDAAALDARQEMHRRFYQWRAGQEAPEAKAEEPDILFGDQALAAFTAGMNLVQAAIKGANDETQALIEQFERMFGVMGSFEESLQPGIDALGQFGRQMAQNVILSAIYGESFAELARQALEGLATQAGGEALFQLAKGLAMLGAGAFGFPAAAAAAPYHFASAGVFTALAGIAGAGTMALGGFSGGPGGGGASARGGDGGAGGQSLPTATAQGTGGPIEQTVIVDFRNRPLMTQREVEMGIVDGLDGGSRRAGRRRLNLRRLGGGR